VAYGLYLIRGLHHRKVNVGCWPTQIVGC
jgi:hypothetical protein